MEERFALAPDVGIAVCDMDGVAPDCYHSTSIYPEYFKVNGKWRLAEESRMDCAVVLRDDGVLDVVELRNVRAGDKVILGRSENCEEGIFLHVDGFVREGEQNSDQFAFRQGRSRETAYSMDYDNLYSLLRHEHEHGHIVWVVGPAVSFDYDSRRSMQLLIENGFVHGLLAGNALATHDLEASYLRTALGQDIYTQRSLPNGHYNHLDTINAVRRSGSIPRFIEDHGISDGIIYALVKYGIPYVLTSSIRDDGPLPEVVHSTYEGQSAMRGIVRRATTIVCLATQLHTIATGNMAPCFRVVGGEARDGAHGVVGGAVGGAGHGAGCGAVHSVGHGEAGDEGRGAVHGGVDGVVHGEVRPLFIYSIDLSEFATNKLSDRGSLSAIGMVTNVQDFIVNVAKGVGAMA